MNEGESPDNLLGLQQEIRGLRRELELLSSRVVSLEADARAAPQSTIGPAPSPTVGHAAPPPLPKKAPWHQETADE